MTVAVVSPVSAYGRWLIDQDGMKDQPEMGTVLPPIRVDSVGCIIFVGFCVTVIYVLVKLLGWA